MLCGVRAAERAGNVWFLVFFKSIFESSPAIYLVRWRLASPRELAIPTVVERLPSATFLGRKPTARVEAMVEFSSVAARWSSFGGRGWQESMEAGETVPQRAARRSF